MFKKIILIIAIIAVILGIGFVGYGFYKKATTNIPNPVATMEVEDYGTIKIELYPDKAPNTVANFIRLANRGFYNGLTFHRTMPDFVIQGGDKVGDGSGSPSLSDIKDGIETDEQYNIPGEFIANGYTQNTLKHTKGVISMARKDYSQISSLTEYGYNSAGSQFFIMTEDSTSLDGLYAAFGQVIEGMDVVEKISKTEVYYRSSELKEGEEAPKDKEGNTIESDKPKKAPVIKSITVETYGIDYGIPKTVEVFDYNAWLMQQYGGYLY
ncbi:MAG: peptidylprolyl isomerase [Clostridia bacterium]